MFRAWQLLGERVVLTIDVQRYEHEGMQRGDSGQQQCSGQARFSKPHYIARKHTSRHKNIVSAPGKYKGTHFVAGDCKWHAQNSAPGPILTADWPSADDLQSIGRIA